MPPGHSNCNPYAYALHPRALDGYAYCVCVCVGFVFFFAPWNCIFTTLDESVCVAYGPPRRTSVRFKDGNLIGVLEVVFSFTADANFYCFFLATGKVSNVFCE